MISPSLTQRLERIRLGIDRSSGRAVLPAWMTSNLRSPQNQLKPWSFKDHEYQIGILTCEASHLAIMKSSQTGLSELAARAVLGLMTLIEGSHWIYSMQTTTYARKFATARLNPVIQASPLLWGLRDADADSTDLKRIGNSFLYLSGAQKVGQAISVPCRGVIRDETDFCNQAALTAFLSRLTHNEADTEILIDFSTPTLPEWGIDRTYKEGSSNRYMVYHSRCGQWVIIDPANDIVLPGWDETMTALTKGDLVDSRIKPKEAYVKCRHCGNEVTRANMMDPSLRAWVSQYPDRELKSFYVSPLDVPRYNPPSKIIAGVEKYDRQGDWLNFGLGIANLPAGSAVEKGAMARARTGRQVAPSAGAMHGTSIGLDVGKTCHMAVLSQHSGKYVVNWLERIRQKTRGDGTDEVTQVTLQRAGEYGTGKIVVDGGPDVTVPGNIISGSLYQVAWAAYFAKSIKGLTNYTLDEMKQMITIARTDMISELVKEINDGKFVFPADSPDIELLVGHLGKLRLVTRVSETTGNSMSIWTSTDSEDHYAFALLYAYTAWKMQADMYSSNYVVRPSNIVGLTKMPGYGDKDTSQRPHEIWNPSAVFSGGVRR